MTFASVLGVRNPSIIRDNYNLNNAENLGWYFVQAASLTNAPSGYSEFRGYLYVENQHMHYHFQIYIDCQTEKVHIRFHDSDGWASWKEL